MAGEIQAIVTAPLNKEALAAAGVKHSGHTEILAELSNTRDYAMLLMGKELKVIHVTTHVSLRRVPDLVTRDRVLRTIRLAQRTLQGLGQPHGRIAVAGLNPHAGRGRTLRRRGGSRDHPRDRGRARRRAQRDRSAARRHALLPRPRRRV